jgi:hypothetical protein
MSIRTKPTTTGFEALVEQLVRERAPETPLNKSPNAQRAARSTYDACLWVLRTYGTARLADAWMLPRLAEFSPEQMRELIAAMHRLKASGQWPNVTDELVAKLEGMR